MIGISREDQKKARDDVGKVGNVLGRGFYNMWIGGAYNVKNDSNRTVWMRSYNCRDVMDAVGAGLTLAGFVDHPAVEAAATTGTVLQTLVANLEDARDALRHKGFTEVKPGKSFKKAATALLVQDCMVVCEPPTAVAAWKVAHNIAARTTGAVRGYYDNGYAVKTLFDLAIKYYQDSKAGDLRGFRAWTGVSKNDRNYCLSKNCREVYDKSNKLHAEESKPWAKL